MQNTLDGFLNSPYGYAIFFVMLWCCICVLISLSSGWLALSGRFRAHSNPYGQMRSAGPFFYTIYMRFWTHYSGIIRITAAEDALYLSVFFLLRIGHPPLCIPWNEIQIGRTKYFWSRYVVLMLGNSERIPVNISERMARKLGILDRISKDSSLFSEPNFDTLSDSFVESQKLKLH